jgi:hypothetical protein
LRIEAYAARSSAVELVALVVPVHLADVVEDRGSHLGIGVGERLLSNPRLCGDGGEQDEQEHEKQKEAGHTAPPFAVAFFGYFGSV